MTIYHDTLEIMNKKLEEFIKRYEGLAIQEPFSYKIFETLKEILNEKVKDLSSDLNKIKLIEQVYNESFRSLSLDYTKKEQDLEASLREKVKSIVEKNIEKCKLLRKEIDDKKIKTKNEENDLLMDVEFFFRSSEQHVDLFEREYDDNIARYIYQNSLAKESYATNTIQNNNSLEKDLRDLEEKHKTNLLEYDQNTERIIDHYKKNEQELNEIYNKKLAEFSALLSGNKKLKRQESMELNNKIRAIVSERNDKISQARQEYAKRQAEAQSDKEAKRQEFQMENQKISREFISNLNSLDAESTAIKDNYSNCVDNEKRLLFYKLLELKKEEEKELINLYSSPEYAKKDVKKIKNQYYKYSVLERKNTDKTLKNLSNSYQIDVEKSHYQRKLLDLDRNYDIKSVLEHESYNNKIFQETNNEYENEMNLQIQLHNFEFNTKANKIRVENTLKILKDEKDFDEIEALHSIETEKLLSQIKFIKYEIDSFEEIRELYHTYENAKYSLTSNFKTVNNVLEIEKCKALDTLNRSLFALNEKSAKMVLDTSKEAMELKNKEYELEANSKIQLNKLYLKNDEMKFQYNIESIKLEETYEIDVANRNYYYELDSLGHIYLSEKFKLEYKKILQHLSVTNKLLKDIIILCVSSLDYVFKNVTIRPEYLQSLRSFVKEYTALIFEMMQRFIGNYHTVVDDIIKERLEFEESLKYKGFYKNIEVQHKEDVVKLEGKKEEFTKQIDAIDKVLEDNRNQISTIDNELFLKREKMKQDSIPFRVFKDEILNLQSIRRQIETENLKNAKRILVLKKEVTHLDNQIAQFNLSYARQQEDIKKLQLTNAQAYTELKKGLERHINIYYSDITTKLRIPESQEFQFSDYSSLVKQRYDMNVDLTLEFIEDTYTIINKFSDSEREAIAKSSEILDNSYQTDLGELEREYSNNVLDNKETWIREDAIRADEIQKAKHDIAQKKQAMYQEIKNHEAQVKQYTQEIQEEINAANRLFYTDFYSICANQQQIITATDSKIATLTEEYTKNRTIIMDRLKKSKEALKQSVDEFVKSQNDVLEHLPQAVKEQEKSIYDEANKKNIEMDEDLSDIKLKNTIQKKEIKKNKGLIDQAFFVKQEEIDKEHKASRVKEKKYHLSQMRHIGQ